MPMRSNILSIATALPPYSLSQEALANHYCSLLDLQDDKAKRLRKIFSHSLIERRHSVIELATNKSLFGPGSLSPGTAIRNEIYKRKAPELAALAAKKAMEGVDSPITHVISVSCTGMMAPGIEFLLLDRLGLSSSTARLGVNFMGCFGAFKGLSVANALAKEDPNNRVLVVCTELCSLHFQADQEADTFVANGLFADGAAAVIVGCEPRPHEKPLWEIHKFVSKALEDTEEHMTWDAGDSGYVMRLSYDVPLQVRGHIKELADQLRVEGLELSQHGWAVHPGGKAILHGIAQTLGLTRDHLAPSYEVLRDFGNMSSPTFLFVLDAIKRPLKWTIGFGFGPGLSMEGILLRRSDA